MIEKSVLENKKTRNRQGSDARPVFSFLAVMAALVVIFTTTGVSPFGPRSVLVSDLSAQYAPYLATLRNKLLSGRSLTYSFEIGMGKNFMGILAYYLSSPLNLLTLLFPVSHISEAVLLLITLKISLAGAFMTSYLDHRFQDRSKMSILFGMIYALCSFSMSFIFNFIWLDGFALLPLLILVTDDFRKNRKNAWKLLAVLIVLFLSGYYMAYMAGLFSFFYLLATLEYGQLKAKDIEDADRKNDPSSGKTVGSFLLIAIIAALICAFLLLPAGLDTLRNGDQSSSFSVSLDPKFPLIQLLPQFFLGKLTDISTNMPFIYSSLLIFLLVVLFFSNIGIRTALKLRAGLYIGLGLLSFLLPPLDTAWHLFDSPNWFLYRYAYLFIFGSILLAYYSFVHLKTLQNRDFIRSFGVFFLLLVLAECFGSEKSGSSMFFQNLFLGLLLTVCLWGLTKDSWTPSLANLRKWGSGILVPIVLVEIVFLAPKVTVGAIWNDSQDAASFRSEVGQLRDVTSSVRESASRLEATTSLGTNLDSLTVSSYTETRGISAFCSMSNKKLHHFLKQLGYCTNYNYFSVEHRNVILPADAVLGVRYFVSPSGRNTYLPVLASSERYVLLENPYALHIAFCADPKAWDFDGYALEKALKNKDYFAFQEAWLSSLSEDPAGDLYDTRIPEWTVINGQKMSSGQDEMTLEYDAGKDRLNLENIPEGNTNLTYYIRSTSSMPLVLRTEVLAEKDSPLYLSLPFLMRGAPVSVYCNGELIYKEDSTSYYSVILDTGVHAEGEALAIEIRCNDDIFASFDPILAYCDLDILAGITADLEQSVSDVSVTDGHVTFTCDAKDSRTLITTIPYEDGWTVKVDGKTVEAVPYQDAFVSFPVDAGHHLIEMHFTPPGLFPGVILSIVGILAGAAVLFLIQRSVRKQTHA